MKFLKCNVAGAWVIDPTSHPDKRGLSNPDLQRSFALQHDQNVKSYRLPANALGSVGFTVPRPGPLPTVRH